MAGKWISGWFEIGNADIVTAVLVILACFLTYKVLQPLTSPLRKIPGLPYIPLLGNMRYIMKGQAMEATINMVKKYGPLVRYYFLFGSERAMVADPDLLKYILVTNSRNYVKPEQRMRLMSMVLGKGLVTSEGQLHAAHKRLMGPAFNQQSVIKMIPLFESRIRQLVEYWTKCIAANDERSAVVPIHADLQRVTLDIIGLAAFGYDFNSLNSGSHHAVTVAAHGLMSEITLSWRSLLPFYIHLPIEEVRRFKQHIQTLNTVIQDIIRKKRMSLSEEPGVHSSGYDILSQMIAARDEDTGEGMTDELLRDQIMTLMMAGHETTAVGMAWCLLMLATHQQVQDKARQEILSVTGSADHLDHDLINELQYCGCIVKETLRLLPPVPLTLRQALNDDILPGGQFIPAGTILQMSMGPMMRREEVYSDGETFRPERFLEKDIESNLYKFAPFIYGPRQCLGYRFALIEMRTMVALLLRYFKFDLDPTAPNYRRTFAITMRPSPPLKLRVSLV